MIQIIVATNRKDSRSGLLAKNIQKRFQKLDITSEIMNLSKISWSELEHNLYGTDNVPISMKPMIQKINEADGLYIVCPEYNGSFPGVIKVFIDYWDYPKSFEKRPICFTGLGGMFGGLRPVEHLQQVFGYRNAFIFPERVFIQNIWETLSLEGVISNDSMNQLLDQQTDGFSKFIKGLKQNGLHCNS